MENEGDGGTNCNWCTWNNKRMIDKGTGRLGNERANVNYLDNSIIDISQNTEESPGDLRRVAVAQMRETLSLLLSFFSLKSFSEQLFLWSFSEISFLKYPGFFPVF